MKIVLFGATGYLGSHIAEQLCESKRQVHCLVRQGSDLSFLETLDVEITSVDFSDLEKHRELIGKDSVVINCIADTSKHKSYAQRKVVEMDLTTRIFKLAQAQKAQRFIQLSTVMAYGFDHPATPINEEYPLNPEYIYSRIAADRETALIEAWQEGGTELLIVRPSSTLGKRDKSFLGNFAKSNRQGVFPMVGGGNWSFSCMDARDVGRAFDHLLQVRSSAPEIFLVKAYDLTWQQFKEALDTFLGKQTKPFNMPKRLVLVVGRILEAVYPYGSTPPLTRFDMRVLSSDMLFDDAKIRATGFEPRYTLIDGFEDYFGKSSREEQP